MDLFEYDSTWDLILHGITLSLVISSTIKLVWNYILKLNYEQEGTVLIKFY